MYTHTHTYTHVHTHVHTQTLHLLSDFVDVMGCPPNRRVWHGELREHLGEIEAALLRQVRACVIVLCVCVRVCVCGVCACLCVWVWMWVWVWVYLFKGCC